MAKKKKISQNYMDTILIPASSQKWSEREDGIIVIDMENKGFYHRIAQKFFHRPKVSHIALDKYGTAVWNALDGTNSVFDVVNHMIEQFPEEEERMLDRVITYLHTLQVNHFITTVKP
jgi:hypothetical protein